MTELTSSASQTPGADDFEEFPTQVKGGGNWFQVGLDSLAGTAEEVAVATELSNEQRQMFAAAGIEHLTAGVPTLHPRILSAGTTFAGLHSRMASSQLANRVFATTTRQVYEGYRAGEEAVLGLFEGAVRLGAFFFHLSQFPGARDSLEFVDQAYGALPSAFRLFTLIGTRGAAGFGRGGQVLMGWSLLQTHGPDLRQPGQIWSEVVAMDVGDPVDAGVHRGDGTATGYLETVGEAGGDIVVSTVTDDDGSVRHMVHLHGLDLDPSEFSAENLADGRGVLAGWDAMGEDSTVHSQAVMAALDAAGANEGEEVFVSGYSLGGKQAADLAANEAFNQRYELGGVMTLGAPHSQRTLPFGVPVTHFQDRNDPVPRLTAERGRVSSDRTTVEYNRTPDERHGFTVFGDNHPFQHNLEAIRSLEHPDNDALDEEHRATLDAFAQANDGEVETRTFTGSWRHDLNPDAIEALEQQARDLSDSVESGVERGMELAEESADEIAETLIESQRFSVPPVPGAEPAPIPGTGHAPIPDGGSVPLPVTPAPSDATEIPVVPPGSGSGAHMPVVPSAPWEEPEQLLSESEEQLRR